MAKGIMTDLEKYNKTEITRNMVGWLPFIWIKKSMKVFIGEDYRLEFILIKDLIKTGKGNSKIEFLEIRALEGFEFIGIKRL